MSFGLADAVQVTDGQSVSLTMLVSQAGGNPIHVGPLCRMMDSGAQLIMIGTNLAQELWLMANDLNPCSFTIVCIKPKDPSAVFFTYVCSFSYDGCDQI